MNNWHANTCWILLFTGMLTGGLARAHDPVFGIGPHVLFKGGARWHPNSKWQR